MKVLIYKVFMPMNLFQGIFVWMNYYWFNYALTSTDISSAKISTNIWYKQWLQKPGSFLRLSRIIIFCEQILETLSVCHILRKFILCIWDWIKQRKTINFGAQLSNESIEQDALPQNTDFMHAISVLLMIFTNYFSAFQPLAHPVFSLRFLIRHIHHLTSCN